MDKKYNNSHPLFNDLTSGNVQKGKIVSAKEAVDLIQDNDTVVVSGFVGTGIPEKILVELENKFLKTKTIISKMIKRDISENTLYPFLDRKECMKKLWKTD